MEQQEYMMPEDMHFQTFNDVIPPESTIKREDLKDEYDIFLFAHLDNITNNLVASSNDLPFVPDVDMSQQMQEQMSERPRLMENQLDNPINKENMDLNRFSNIIKEQAPDLNGTNTSHFVRYKLQDGKHVKIWECGICQKDFTHQYTLMRHLPTHTDERKFQCITCGKAFRQMSTLSQHRAIHSTERPYICEICQKTFNRVSTLISHRKTHTGLKSHRCHLCTKAFHQKGNLRNHIFTHTNERPYKCDICEKGFNQMSNLMCHKFKAHQRTEKPKFVCQVCGKSFPKRVGLRQHEQYTHKIVNPLAPTPISSSQLVDKINYTNAIIVEPIKTEAMRLAIESNQTPFALLRPVTGIPVLVRVLPAGDKQMLVPASAEDLKKHSHISIMAKGEKPSPDGKKVGSTVQIKIPVVATVIQQNDQTGQMSMSIVSPGPNGELGDQTGLMGSKINNFVYSSTLTNCSASTSPGDALNNELNIEDLPITGDFTQSGILQNVNIEFLDEQGQKLEHTDFENHLKVGMTNGIIYQTKVGDAEDSTTIDIPKNAFISNPLSLPLL